MGYQRELATRAWRKAVDMVAGHSKSEQFVRLVGVLMTLGFFYLYVENVDRKSEAFTDAQLTALVGVGVFLSVFVLFFLFCFLWLIPWEMWLEKDEKLTKIEALIAPRLSIDCLGPQKIEDVEFCRVSPTIGGTPYLVINELGKGITLSVKNTGEITLKGCQAFLANFKRVDSDEEPITWEPLPLPWVPLEENCKTTDIPGLTGRSIWLMRITRNKPCFVTTQMPLPMATQLKDKGCYEGLIVLSADGIGASHYPFTLVCDGPDNQPVFTLTRLDSDAI